MKKIIILYIMILSLNLYGCSKDNKNLSIHIIDVGQGDSILIKTPGKKNILIDGGTEDSYSIIKNYLRKEKIKKIDIIIATHPDSDHIGSLDNIIDKFNVDKIYMPNKSHNSDSFKSLNSSMSNKNLTPKYLSSGDRIDIEDSIFMDILSPDKIYDENNLNSIVSNLTYKNKSFLFTGDAEIANENKILSSFNISSINFLKVAHHGSNSSTSETFLENLSPEIAIISCGYNNPYNHPNDDVIDRLNKNNISIYRTDIQRHIVFFCDGDSIYTHTKPVNYELIKKN